MSSPLENLPRELLSMIVDFVGADDLVAPGNYGNLPTGSYFLTQLARVSRVFHTPVSIALNNRTVLRQSGQHATVLLLKRFLDRPQLAECITSFHCSNCPLPLDMSNLSKENLRQCEAILLEMGLRDRVHCDWLEDLNDGVWHAIIALVLSFLPNLEELRLMTHGMDVEELDYGSPMNYYLADFIKNARILQGNGKRSRFSLAKLATVSTIRGTRRGVNGLRTTHDADDYLKLPSLQTIHVENMLCRPGRLTTNVKTLCLRGGVVYQRLLEEFLYGFKNLRKLHIVICELPDIRPHSADGGSVLPHCLQLENPQRLEELTLIEDLREGGADSPRLGPRLGPGRLHLRPEWQSLHNLIYARIACAYLRPNAREEKICPNILPTSLRFLELTGCDKFALESVLRVLSSISSNSVGQFSLESVVLEFTKEAWASYGSVWPSRVSRGQGTFAEFVRAEAANLRIRCSINIVSNETAENLYSRTCL